MRKVWKMTDEQMKRVDGALIQLRAQKATLLEALERIATSHEGRQVYGQHCVDLVRIAQEAVDGIKLASADQVLVR